MNKILWDDAFRIFAAGEVEWIVRDRGKIKRRGVMNNAATTVGLNTMLNNMFRTPTTYSWYLGVIDNSGFSAVAAADSMGSHPGWTEHTAGYSEANRPQWSPDAAASALIANSSATVFTGTGAGFTAQGIFVASNNTKGGTTGILWATALNTSPITITTGNTWSLTYRGRLTAI